MSKSPKKTGTRLGSYGERVARERAARRRAAKERALRDRPKHEDAVAVEEAPAEPETAEIPQSDLANELSVLAAAIASGLARSHTEAKRLLNEPGITVNGAPVLSDKAKLTLRDVAADGVIRLGLGEKRQVLLKPV